MKNFKKRATQKTLIELHESVFSQHSRILSFHWIDEYIKPVGGGYFFVLPGVQSKGRFLRRRSVARSGVGLRDFNAGRAAYGSAI
jgi:hypothetical protein